MTDEAMSPLRRRMIEDMTIRKLSPKTQQGYIRTIKNLAVFLGRSPDTASFEDIRCFQLHLASSGAGTPILNQTVAALRFFFRVTLKRHAIIERPALAPLPSVSPHHHLCTGKLTEAGRRCLAGPSRETLDGGQRQMRTMR
jgi:integrase/recombinase XerD